MALGLSFEGGGGGQYLPIVKFDAKSGDWMIVNRVQGGDGKWVKQDVELQTPFRCIIDLAEIEVGWMAFMPTGPDFKLVKLTEKMPPRPTADHKQGVRMLMFFREHGLREMATSSKVVMQAIDVLHTDFLAQAGANVGKMPVVECSGADTRKITTQQGELRFKAPKLSIVGWQAKPEGWKLPEPAPAAAAVDSAPVSRASNVPADAEF